MPQVQMKIVGGKELAAALKTLPEKVQKKILRPAMFQATAVILSEARRLAHVLTGLLKSTLTAKVRFSKNGAVRGIVQTKAGDYRGETFYGSFLEYGHKHGSRRSMRSATMRGLITKMRGESRAARARGGGLAVKGSAFRARQEAYFAREAARQTMGMREDRTWVKAQPFMRPAFDNTRGEAVQIFVDMIREGVTKALSRRAA